MYDPRAGLRKPHFQQRLKTSWSHVRLTSVIDNLNNLHPPGLPDAMFTPVYDAPGPPYTIDVSLGIGEPATYPCISFKAS